MYSNVSRASSRVFASIPYAPRRRAQLLLLAVTLLAGWSYLAGAEAPCGGVLEMTPMAGPEAAGSPAGP